MQQQVFGIFFNIEYTFGSNNIGMFRIELNFY